MLAETDLGLSLRLSTKVPAESPSLSGKTIKSRAFPPLLLSTFGVVVDNSEQAPVVHARRPS